MQIGILMILLLSNIYNEDQLTLLEDRLGWWKFDKQYDKGSIKEFIKYFPFVNLSNMDIKSISVYIFLMIIVDILLGCSMVKAVLFDIIF